MESTAYYICCNNQLSKKCRFKKIIRKRKIHILIIQKNERKNKMTDETAKDLYYLNMQTYKKMPKEYRNWIYWDEYHNKSTGFSGWCYKKDGKVVMIVKGTDVFEKKDIVDDYALANNRVPEQFKDAKYSKNITNYGYYKDPIFNANRDNMIGKVYLTGRKNEKIQTESMDFRNIEKHFPTFVYDMENTQEYQPKEHLTVKDKLLNGNYSLYNHLSKRQKASISADLIEESSPKSLKGGVEIVRKIGAKTLDAQDSFEQKAKLALRPAERLKQKLKEEWDNAADAKNKLIEKFKSQKTLSGYVNHFTKSERIFTKEEIENMPYKKQRELKDAINYQKEKIGIPTKEMADKAVKSGGMVHVKEYIRADGIKVHSYYRARPGK